MWLPIEIVNIIMEYAGTGQYLCYCSEFNSHILRYNPQHDRFQFLSDLYKYMDIETVHNKTIFQYVIPLRKIPSVTSRIQNIDNIQNIMSVSITENDTEIVSEHYTTIVIERKHSALLL